MPATENVWRNLRMMHWFFVASCVLLCIASAWAMYADYNDEWRVPQRLGFKLASQQLHDDERAEETFSFTKQTEQLEARLQAADNEIKTHSSQIAEIELEGREIGGKLELLLRQVRALRAERDKARADMGLQISAGVEGEALRPAQENFDTRQKTVDEQELALQKLQQQSDANKAKMTAITKHRDEIAAELKKHLAKAVQLAKARQQVDPKGALAAGKWDLMELPIIEGFNGHLKPTQIWLPKLKINYGGMGDVARFDRCLTCHMNIDKVKSGGVPAYPFDHHGVTVATGHEYLQKDAAAEQTALRNLQAATAAVEEAKAAKDAAEVSKNEKELAKATTDLAKAEAAELAASKRYYSIPNRTYGHPFATHPNTDLFLTSASPHPMQKFGCTSCHEGQGSGTSFHNVQHMPNHPAKGESWGKQFGWFPNHYWEFPMYPNRLAEAACIKCHHNVVELGVNPTYGASAPKVVEGYNLIRQYGCYGCHEINGYSAGVSIGPDMRLEPQTEDEAARIAADPTATAGTMRKVGPGLRHFASKADIDFAEEWIKDPTKIHPETRMPRFFHLSNQQDADAAKFQPVEIAGIAKYLDSASEEMVIDPWEKGYVPSIERGKKLFSERGCLACHKHEDFPGSVADFAPDLSHAHTKIRRDAMKTKVMVSGEKTEEIALSSWLYTWVRDPDRHSSRTRMPNLYLEATGEGDSRVDPAADIVAYLLHKPVSKFPGIDNEAANFDADMNDLVRLFLKKSLSAAALDAYMGSGVYPTPANDLKGDEVELSLKALVGRLASDQENLRKDILERLDQSNMKQQSDWFKELSGTLSTTKKNQAIAETKLLYIGRRSISRYGCYGCHDIPGYERARPIGTGLADWGRKDPAKLSVEHIEEYLHHHGEPDGSSTLTRIEKSIDEARGAKFASKEEEVKATSAAYFVDQLSHHGRAGFIWQKLRDPRSYDYLMTTTKGYDERLRMPQFKFAQTPLDNEQKIESVATFVLGLVADPPAQEFQYHPNPVAKARIEGEKLVTKFNCVSCHVLELPKVQYQTPVEEFRVDVSSNAKWNVLRDKLASAAVLPVGRGITESDLEMVSLSNAAEFTKRMAAIPGNTARTVITQSELAKLHDRLRSEFEMTFKPDFSKAYQKLSMVLKKLKLGEVKADINDEQSWLNFLSQIGAEVEGPKGLETVTVKTADSYPKDPKEFVKYTQANLKDLGVRFIDEVEAPLYAKLDALIQQLAFSDWTKSDPYRKDDKPDWKSLSESLNKSELLPVLRGVTDLEFLSVTGATLDKVTKKLADSKEEATGVTVSPAAVLALHQRLVNETVEPGKIKALIDALWWADFTSTDALSNGQLLVSLKAPPPDKLHGVATGEHDVSFHGMLLSAPSPDDEPEDAEYTYDVWETTELNQKLLLPHSKVTFSALKLKHVTPARGGHFAEWLVDELMKQNPDNNRYMSWQMSPPPLYQEGIKVQTAWLYNFLKNPHQIRFTTRLRMPKFNMSDDEAHALANYFAAVDGAEYPYQSVPERTPTYLARQNVVLHEQLPEEKKQYLDVTWDAINVKLCNGCHAVAAKPYAGNPNDPKNIRGPNLDVVADRLRPDWLKLWITKPDWITPYTSMPAPYPPAQRQANGTYKHTFPELLGGNTPERIGTAQELLQVQATRDGLMNYHQLMEHQRAVMAQATPAKPDAEKVEPQPEAKPEVQPEKKPDAEKPEPKAEAAEAKPAGTQSADVKTGEGQ